MIEYIDHVGIAVESIEESRKYYERLGLQVTAIEDAPQEKVRIALIPCGQSRIELLEPTTPDSPIAKFLAKNGPGIHHLCLHSDDILGDDVALKDAGFHLLRPGPTPGSDGQRIQFVHPKSFGGVLLELAGKARSESPEEERAERPVPESADV